MLPNHEGVLKPAHKDEKSWWNTFSNDLVFEEWKKLEDDFYKDWTQRITFAKTKSNGYAFIGVYKPEQIIDEIGGDGRQHYIKIYRRIEKNYER